MSDTQVVVGTLEGITEKPTGWTTISVSVPGKTYPIKFDTKIKAIIDEARAAGTNVASWSYTEHDSGNPNPNKPGTNFINRRLEKVGPPNAHVEDDSGPTHVPPQGWEQAEKDSAPRPQASSTSSAPTHAPLPPGDKDRAITRMAVLKAAAEIVAGELAGGGQVLDPGAEVISNAARFETWVYRDVDDVPF